MKKSSPKARKRKSTAAKRPRAKMVVISDEMKVWSGMLVSELNSWPDISTKTMFGFLSFYRKGSIFAALPHTRGFNSASAFIFKFNPMTAALLKRAEHDTRIDTSTRVIGKRWFTFEVNSEGDLRDALFWLNQAYEAATK